MSLYLLVIAEMPDVEFFEDILKGDEAMGVLFDDVRLGLFDVFADIPYMDWVAVPSYQPHLIDINLDLHNDK